ncbi:MAG: helix-turn-helix domain-containing protein [Gemmataceae bacterium]
MSAISPCSSSSVCEHPFTCGVALTPQVQTVEFFSALELGRHSKAGLMPRRCCRVPAPPEKSTLKRSISTSDDSAPGARLAYSINDFCRLAGIGRSLTYSEIGRGRLETVKVGRRTLITRQAADEFFHRLERESDQ